jgi:hypothetical protein
MFIIHLPYIRPYKYVKKWDGLRTCPRIIYVYLIRFLYRIIRMVIIRIYIIYYKRIYKYVYNTFTYIRKKNGMGCGHVHGLYTFISYVYIPYNTYGYNGYYTYLILICVYWEGSRTTGRGRKGRCNMRLGALRRKK